MTEKKLTIISLDGHSAMRPEDWPTYLEKRFHDYLPALQEENDAITRFNTYHLAQTHSEPQLEVFDLDRAYRSGGYNGVYDRDIRLAQMDREGIAAEFCFDGDPRILGMFFMSCNREYPQDLCNAGVKGYHRWLNDAFGPAKDRLIPVGILGHAPWASMDDMLEEFDWMVERGFRATSLPGFVTYPGHRPLFDRSWDPLWARCEEAGVALWVHAGHGEKQGELGREMLRVGKAINEDGSNFVGLVREHISDLFGGNVFTCLKPRRAMWQLMMGGVFDRFPRLKLVMNEVYGDWIPGTLRFLDKEFEAHRGEFACERRPSDYWHSNCLTSLSFPRKCEIALRHEVGIDTVTFGRDYPHPEGTWPNTKLWLRDVFTGVPVNEVRAILGDNVIRLLNLDRDHLEAVAARIGPSVEEITEGPPVSRDLIAHFDKRGQYLQEPERDEQQVPAMRVLMREDLWLSHSAA
jgi:predicted TIM-barrel fold metal-dependent hydrolase